MSLFMASTETKIVPHLNISLKISIECSIKLQSLRRTGDFEISVHRT